MGSSPQLTSHVPESENIARELVPLLSNPQALDEAWNEAVAEANGLSEADWTKAGHALARIEGSLSWWLGDWWAYGHTYGKRKALVESEEWEGPAFQTCANAALVCNAFKTSRRREALSFKHHAEVLSIEDAHVQDRFLDWCEEGVSLNGGKPRSTRELRRAVRAYLDEQGWSEDERYRRERAKAGITVVANLRGAMKAVAKPKTVTVTDLQEADLSEKLSDIVPASLYRCDFRRIELIQPESIDWGITMFSPASLPGRSTIKGCGSFWTNSHLGRVRHTDDARCLSSAFVLAESHIANISF